MSTATVDVRRLWVAVALAATLLVTGPAGAADEADDTISDTAFLATILLERQNSEGVNRRIPVDLRLAARCIAVFPSVVKAGLIVAAKHGNGLVACRAEERGLWGSPAVYSVTAASVGIQAGIQNASYVLLFMDERAVADLLAERVTFGNDVSIAAGPVGAAAYYTEMPSVISYVQTEGLFAGVDLESAQITYTTAANAKLYGDAASAETVLKGELNVPLALQPFHAALDSFSPGL